MIVVKKYTKRGDIGSPHKKQAPHYLGLKINHEYELNRGLPFQKLPNPTELVFPKMKCPSLYSKEKYGIALWPQ